MKWLAKFISVLLLTAVSANAQIFTWTDAGDKVGDSDFASMIWVKSFSAADMIRAVGQLQARPAGMRCMFLWCDRDAIYDSPADQLSPQFKSLWWPKGTAAALTHNNSLIAQLKAAKVLPDVVVLDNEAGSNSFSLTQANLDAIAADPRGKALGIVTSDVVSDTARSTFDAIANRAENAAIWKGIFDPYHSYAPNAVLSQFSQFILTAAEGELLKDHNNHLLFSDSLAGTVASPAIYGGAGLNPVTQTAFGEVVYAVNALRLISHHSAIMPWYSGDGLAGSKWQGTNYWGECMRHGLLTCGLRGLLFDAGQPTAAKQLEAIYKETKTAVAGKMPTTLCSSEFVDVNAGYIVTARADNWPGSNTPTRIVGRVTFAPGVSSATFTVANQPFTVSAAAGQSGAWFSFGAIKTSVTAPTTVTKTKTVTKPTIRKVIPLQPIAY